MNGDNIRAINITRLDNALEGIQSKKQGCEEQLTNVRAQMETAKTAVQAPFPREAELAEKMSRLAELTIALKLDEKDHEVLDEAPDEGDKSPVKKRIMSGSSQIFRMSAVVVEWRMKASDTA